MADKNRTHTFFNIVFLLIKNQTRWPGTQSGMSRRRKNPVTPQEGCNRKEKMPKKKKDREQGEEKFHGRRE